MMRIRNSVLVLALSSPVLAAPPASEPALKVAPGFKVTLWADSDMANDIYAMTLDSKGRVVVTSAGWIKRLEDTKGAGKADKVTVIGKTATGGMGMCFDDDDLWFCGDGWLSRMRYGITEKLFPFDPGEHGGHAIRKGPDGWFYVICGNNSGLGAAHVTRADSPIKKPEAGGIVRVSPDGKECEVVAHGFRNPYDFDFNVLGDIFTYDSDCEREFFLPWYSPTRIYHVAPGQHHGWRLTGHLRGYARPDYSPATTDILWPVGRGSPTGVVCYRHNRFPSHYSGGLFALDWTFGKIWFLPLTPDGAGYTTKAELFLEPTGTGGFAPTDICVAPDGSLFVCIGGRRTRGAIYKIDIAVEPEVFGVGASTLHWILTRPQPLDAWSRAEWEPAAARLGVERFNKCAVDEKESDLLRVRAIEIITEMFGGLDDATAAVTAASKSVVVRARTAWSLGRKGGAGPRLAALAQDTNPHVACRALEALADRAVELDGETAGKILPYKLGSHDKRVRMAAATLASRLPDNLWNAVRGSAGRLEPQARLSVALADIWRRPGNDAHPTALRLALNTLAGVKDEDLRLQAVCLIIEALGGYHLDKPTVEVWTAYSLPGLRTDHADVRAAVRAIFPAKDEILSREAARLLAMLEDDDDALPAKVAAMWTDKTGPTEDMHYLIVLSRLRGKWPEGMAARVANAILSLDRKLEGRQQRSKQVWGERLAEAVTALLKRDPALEAELLKHPRFTDASHVGLAMLLAAEKRPEAAVRFLKAAKADEEYVWSGELLELLSALPADEVRAVLRKQWSNFGLRDQILLQLAKTPEPQDRARFLAGLESAQPAVIRTALGAMELIPAGAAADDLVALASLLRRLTSEPEQPALRRQALAMLAKRSGRSWEIAEPAKPDAAALRQAYQPVFDWLAKEHPALAAKLDGGEDPAAWAKVLAEVKWADGSAARGEAVFRARACQTCHSGPRALGPDLAGAADRFSRDDLFAAIIQPSKDVAPPYRTTVVRTKDGQVYNGIVAFESADGLILQTGATTTVRLADADIAGRRPGTLSLMPNGLLKDLKPADLADLYAYLKSLKAAAK